MTSRVLWTTAILLGLLLQQALFYISIGFVFRCFSRFYFILYIRGRPLPFYGICSLPFYGTYVFSRGLACFWARHMTDHGLGPFLSLTDQLGDFGLFWRTLGNVLL